MYKDIGHVVSAIERPDLNQVLSRLGDNTSLSALLGALFPGRASPCSPLPTLPGAVSAVLPLCRDSPGKVVLFVNFFWRNVKCVCMHSRTCKKQHIVLVEIVQQ